MYNRNIEVREAIEAGERALASLRDARESLGSARNWGLLDLLGGRSISGLVKHVGDFLTFADFFFDGFLADILVQSKIRQAQDRIDDAIYRVESVLRQLRNYR